MDFEFWLTPMRLASAATTIFPQQPGPSCEGLSGSRIGPLQDSESRRWLDRNEGAHSFDTHHSRNALRRSLEVTHARRHHESPGNEDKLREDRIPASR